MKHRTLLIAAFVLSFAGPALANGGGGGGASLPSSSGPSYDPVEEYQSGVEYLRQQDYRKAERAFKRVVSVARKDANSHLLLGVAHMGQEEWRPASRALKKALRYDPNLHDARGRLAVAYTQMGKADDAQEQVDALNAAKASCAGTCAEAEAIDKALAMAGQSVDTSALPPAIEQASAASGDAAYLGAVRLINLENYAGAKIELLEARDAFGPHPDVLTYLGFANRKQGNYDIALAYYSAALDVAPGHLGAHEYLGEYFVETGNMTAAYRQLDTLNALCPFGCAELTELEKWIEQGAS